MKILIMVAATVLLGACANQGDTQQTDMSRNQQPPSQFQSVGSCEPTAWVGLQNDAERLPPEQKLHVKMMLDNAQSYYADDNRGQCILVLQNAEKIVRQYDPSF